jgi:hypothetical protein
VRACGCVICARVLTQVFINNELSLGRQFGQASPGPAVGYQLPQSMGVKQPEGKKADTPNWAFSRALRFPVSHFANDPAPNKYSLPSAIRGGKPQPLSRVRSEPSFGFGTCKREVVRKGNAPSPLTTLSLPSHTAQLPRPHCCVTMWTVLMTARSLALAFALSLSLARSLARALSLSPY